MRPCLPLGAGRVSQCVEWRVRDSGIADLHSGDQGTVVKGVGAAAAVRDAGVGGQGSGFPCELGEGREGLKVHAPRVPTSVPGEDAVAGGRPPCHVLTWPLCWGGEGPVTLVPTGTAALLDQGPPCDPSPLATSLEAPSLITAPPGVTAMNFGGTQFSLNRSPPGGVGSLRADPSRDLWPGAISLSALHRGAAGPEPGTSPATPPCAGHGSSVASAGGGGSAWQEVGAAALPHGFPLGFRWSMAPDGAAAGALSPPPPCAPHPVPRTPLPRIPHPTSPPQGRPAPRTLHPPPPQGAGSGSGWRSGRTPLAALGFHARSPEQSHNERLGCSSAPGLGPRTRGPWALLR